MNTHESFAPGGGAGAESLRREINQLQHELRRMQDGLERNPTSALEQRARQLRDNIALCERELAAELSNCGNRSGDE